MHRLPLLLMLLLVARSSSGQRTDALAVQPEFPKGWRFPLELSQGPVPSDGRYGGWVALGASYTVLPGHLRVGAVAGPGLFADRGVGVGGARLSWRVKSFLTDFGSWGNAQLVGEHLWSTEGVTLVGGGPVVEAGELVVVGLKGYWPYNSGSDRHPLWMQFSVGLNILKGKRPLSSDDPFSNP